MIVVTLLFSEGKKEVIPGVRRGTLSTKSGAYCWYAPATKTSKNIWIGVYAQLDLKHLLTSFGNESTSGSDWPTLF